MDRNEKLKQAIHLFITTNNYHHNTVENAISDIDCHHSQHRLLCVIKEAQDRNDQLSQKDLADKMEISPAAIAVTLKKMEKSGLIIRHPGEDTRINNITITKKGYQILSETKELFSNINSATFNNISEEELSSFINCLEKMQKNLIEFSKSEDNN